MFSIWFSVVVAAVLGVTGLYSDRLPISSRKTLRGKNAWVVSFFCLAYAVSIAMIELLSPNGLIGLLDQYSNP